MEATLLTQIKDKISDDPLRENFETFSNFFFFQRNNFLLIAADDNSKDTFFLGFNIIFLNEEKPLYF